MEFTSLLWNLIVNLGYLYLSDGEINSTLDIGGIYTDSIFLKSNQTTSVETGKINTSLKFKDNFGGLVLLSDWFRAKFYHTRHNNPASFFINGIAVTMFTEQSQSTLDKFEMEVIFGESGFLHFLGKEQFFSSFYERNINSLIQHQNAPNSIMFGTDTKWSEIDKNGIHLGFSPSTGMSYGIGLSQEKFEWIAHDMGDNTKASRQKKISG